MDVAEEIKKLAGLVDAVQQFSNESAEQMETQPIELVNATGTYLHHLNEDCLLEIFSQKSLTPMDLLSLAATCRLFERVTQRLFPKELNIERHRPPNAHCYIVNFVGNRVVTRTHNVKRIFKHFGSNLVAVSVSGNYTYGTHSVMSMVAKHCVTGTLKELKISGMDISKRLVVAMKPIFQQVQRLSIDYVSTKFRSDTFANCDSLLELNICDVPMWNTILDNNFPKLQRLSFGMLNRPVESYHLSNFIKRYKSLKCLKLAQINMMHVFLQELGESRKELEELEITFDGSYREALDFSQFQSLKQFKLHCNVKPSIVQLQKMESLEKLQITGRFDSNELSAALPLMTNLRELYARFSFETEKFLLTSLTQLTKLRLSGPPHTRDSIVDIIRQLTKLEELRIDCLWSVLSELGFSEIVKVVKGRKNVLTLRCTLGFSQSSEFYLNIFDENLKVKLINTEYWE